MMYICGSSTRCSWRFPPVSSQNGSAANPYSICIDAERINLHCWACCPNCAGLGLPEARFWTGACNQPRRREHFVSDGRSYSGLVPARTCTTAALLRDIFTRSLQRCTHDSYLGRIFRLHVEYAKTDRKTDRALQPATSRAMSALVVFLHLIKISKNISEYATEDGSFSAASKRHLVKKSHVQHASRAVHNLTEIILDYFHFRRMVCLFFAGI